MIYREESALELARSFISNYKQFDQRFPSIERIQKSKWWIHFLRAADQRGSHKDWNSTIWVKCQFEKYGKILPFQLYGKKAEEAFNEFKFRFTEGKSDRQKQIVQSILSTYNLIKNWCIKNNNGKLDYKLFIENNPLKINRGELSKYFLSISRTYNSIYGSNEDLSMKRIIVHKNEKLKEKLKEVMKDEFY